MAEPSPHEPGPSSGRGDASPERWFGPVGLVVLVAGGIGFLAGVDPAEYRSGGFSPARDERPLAGAEPARAHQALIQQPWGSGAQASWAASLEVARSREEGRAEGLAGAGSRERAREERAERRAFAGAPPVVPHPTAGTTAAGCLACHGEGLQLGALVARPLPHARYASCTQCHVSSGAGSGSLEPAVGSANRFQGRVEPGPGARAWGGAPPALPHALRMRENCLSCHGPLGLSGLQTPHAERRSCLQCHALRAAHEPGGPQ